MDFLVLWFKSMMPAWLKRSQKHHDGDWRVHVRAHCDAPEGN